MPVIETKVLRPKKLKIDEVRMALLNALRAEGRAIQKEYEKTVATWAHKPKFEQLIGLDKQQATVLVGTDSRIYKFIDEGTRVRRAVMSKDWQSKTTPNVIGSGPGRGHVVFISKKIALPGIKARNFTKIIQRRRKKPFRNAMLKAARKGAAKANSRGQV